MEFTAQRPGLTRRPVTVTLVSRVHIDLLRIAATLCRR
jgi:hypothetical protein